ncbi:MAG: hypothetical protein RBS39_09880 [Phycisphaerales bacterium]|nr:hypothetical protein [Phycisphaerales bacterium]
MDAHLDEAHPPTEPARLRRLASATLASLAAGLGTIALSGCIAVQTPNPAFPITTREAMREWETIKARHVELERPVLVLGGYRAIPSMARRLRVSLERGTSGRREDFLSISYPWSTDIEAIAARVVESVAERWPGAIVPPDGAASDTQSDGTSEPMRIDVVGISMGGLVARQAARTDMGRPAIRIATLYTLGTPHRGAILAEKITIDRAGRDMRAGSAFMASIDAALSHADFPIVPYAHLRDTWVGATRSAPAGQEPIWTGGTLFLSHQALPDDVRILVDLSKRLRGEEPIGSPSPPPRN